LRQKRGCLKRRRPPLLHHLGFGQRAISAAFLAAILAQRRDLHQQKLEGFRAEEQQDARRQARHIHRAREQQQLRQHFGRPHGRGVV
jgi:hypothetical protein